MASLNKNRKLNWEIQFKNLHGETKTISLAKSRYNEKTACRVKDVVEELMRMQFNGEEGFAKETWLSKWMAETASPELREKLSKVGLIKLIERHTCKELWDAFIPEKAAEIKQTTCEGYKFVKRRFFAFLAKKPACRN